MTCELSLGISEVRNGSLVVCEEGWHCGDIVIGLILCADSLLEAIIFLLTDILVESLCMLECDVFDDRLLLINHNAIWPL